MMIDPLRENLVSHLLDEIHKDRLGNPSLHLMDVIRGVIMSFVSVEEYRKSTSPEVMRDILIFVRSEYINTMIQFMTY